LPLHRLAVRPVDVSGAGLRLALNAPSPAPLATCRLPHPSGGTLVLGVLGASHVISVDHAEHSFSEEISCTAYTEAELPKQADAPGYHLESRTDTHSPADFQRLAHLLRTRCEREADWLGGAFPGDDAALTALVAEPDGAGWHWQTWHLYPYPTGGGTVVYTNSRWRP
jgi:Protein of unknown function DUF2617